MRRERIAHIRGWRSCDSLRVALAFRLDSGPFWPLFYQLIGAPHRPAGSLPWESRTSATQQASRYIRHPGGLRTRTASTQGMVPGILGTTPLSGGGASLAWPAPGLRTGREAQDDPRNDLSAGAGQAGGGHTTGQRPAKGVHSEQAWPSLGTGPPEEQGRGQGTSWEGCQGTDQGIRKKLGLPAEDRGPRA